MFQDKVVVIAGGAKGIGRCIAEKFAKEGAKVCVIDVEENPYFVGDIADEATLQQFAEKVIAQYGRVDCLITNAKPIAKGLDTCTYQEFTYAPQVGNAPFRLSQLFLPYFAPGTAIVNIFSSRDDGVNLLLESNRQNTPVICFRFGNHLYYICFFLVLQSPYVIFNVAIFDSRSVSKNIILCCLRCLCFCSTLCHF